MTGRRPGARGPWTVVLTAGAGRRLSSVTGGVPKQFWRDGHSPSLLTTTVQRYRAVAPPARTVVVVDAAHRAYLSGTAAAADLPVTVLQPQDRGTAAGVLLALLPVLDADSEATVVITPSDHGIADQAAFRRSLRGVVRRVDARGGLVVFGVQAASATSDYGWMSVRPPGGMGSVQAVESFVEKPEAPRAQRLFESGAVWNSMVLVSSAGRIRQLCNELLPDLAEVFAELRRRRVSERRPFLAEIYPSLPTYDFSRDVLARAGDLETVVWPHSMGWSDLGTPERLRAWQRRRAAELAVLDSRR